MFNKPFLTYKKDKIFYLILDQNCVIYFVCFRIKTTVGTQMNSEIGLCEWFYKVLD
jgi:hypothetical protein